MVRAAYFHFMAPSLVRIGRNVHYPTDLLVEWMRATAAYGVAGAMSRRPLMAASSARSMW